MASKGSSKSRAAARGATRAASLSSRGVSLNSAGQAALARAGGGSSSSSSGSARDAAAGLKSVADARAKAGISASPADIRRYQQEEAAAQADLAAAGYSPEFINQVSTFWQQIAALPQDQQDRIMGQLKEQANSTVDYGFDSEQAYLKQLKEAKQKNYDEQLRIYKEAEEADLKKALGETSRGTADQLRSAYAGLANNNAFDTGQMASIAARAMEDQQRLVDEDTGASKRAIDAAVQQRDSASNLLSIQAEQDLLDVANRRAAARSQRLSQLIGLNASQGLLAQVPTLNQLSMPKATEPAKKAAPRPAAAPLALPSIDAGSRSNYDAKTTLKRGSVTYGYADDRARASYRNRSRLLGNY